ncbi:MAG: hypothetical protein JNM70_02105 [Anaerolineae bacterium]|nr:hypothetical protein [Anaerolineae bacterium]
MDKYLIVAEVDKIQSFVFQSSRLREVVGASHLLEEFCKAISGDPKKHFPGITLDILASGGGSFRIVVEGDEAAVEAVGRDLRETFQREVGGSITITHVPFEPKQNVIERGNEALRRAKIGGDAPQALWHLPYHAICESSGSELAVAYERPGGLATERPRYLGPRTREKAKQDAKVAISRELRATMENLTGLGSIGIHEESTEPETYAWESRQYVAYMVADGNHMGAYFDQCSPNTLHELSEESGKRTLKALAEATMHMIERRPKTFPADTLPVLPLISGGDDLFMLMPALWAIDVAARYCKAYEDDETGMTALLRSMNIITSDEKATTGVAVVICKASYPYRIAYQHGHELLGAAKKRAKAIGESCLVINFVVGSDTVVDAKPTLIHTHTGSLYHLTYRYALRGLPNRIRHQVDEALLDDADLKPIINRTKALYPDFDYVDQLAAAAARPEMLRELLKLWDFALDMQHPREDYRSTEA